MPCSPDKSHTSEAKETDAGQAAQMEGASSMGGRKGLGKHVEDQCVGLSSRPPSAGPPTLALLRSQSVSKYFHSCHLLPLTCYSYLTGYTPPSSAAHPESQLPSFLIGLLACDTHFLLEMWGDRARNGEWDNYSFSPPALHPSTSSWASTDRDPCISQGPCRK